MNSASDDTGDPRQLRHYLVGQLNIISGFLELLQADCDAGQAVVAAEYMQALRSACGKALAALCPQTDPAEAAEPSERPDR